jgi:cation diffusion facilitator family transporter
MLAMKCTAYVLTHSAAIFSDALESIVHVAATAMAFYSIIISARPADTSHPYGHGKVEFFSAGVEGGLIVTAAAAMVYEAVRGMIFGRELAEIDAGILLTLGASVVNLFLGWFLISRGRATNSLTLVADGKHVLTDSYTSFGVVAGLGAVKLTGAEILDPLVAIGVAMNILISGYKLMRISVGGLMDESDEKTLHRVTEIIRDERTPAWINVHHLRIMRSGQMHHIDFHLTIPFFWTVDRAHSFQHAIADAFRERLNQKAQVLIHLDPCSPSCCKTCTFPSCPERKEDFKQGPDWTFTALVGKAPC